MENLGRDVSTAGSVSAADYPGTLHSSQAVVGVCTSKVGGGRLCVIIAIKKLISFLKIRRDQTRS